MAEVTQRYQKRRNECGTVLRKSSGTGVPDRSGNGVQHDGMVPEF